MAGVRALGRRARPSFRARLLECLFLLFGVLQSCTCGSSAPLATLQLTLGQVERDFAAQPRAWKSAQVGATFGLGDGVQTRVGSTALLQLQDDEQLSMDPETLIRFSSTPPQRHSLDMELELGAISVQAARTSLAIHTPAGPARIAPGARVGMSRSTGGLRFAVQVGQAVFGASEPVEAGQAVLIDPQGRLSPLAGAERAPTVESNQRAADAEAPPALPETEGVAAHVTGRNARVLSEQGWTPLAEGVTPLPPGAELHVQKDTSVRLERSDEQAVLQPNGRYTVAPRAGVLVAAAEGSVSAGGSGRVRIEVPGGVIEILPQAQASVRLQQRGARVEVQAREVLVKTREGEQRIGVGEGATVLADGHVSVEGRGLDYADLELNAGRSLVIHDPAPPTAVRFAFGRACPGRGVLQLFQSGRARAYAAGGDAVSLSMAPGNYRYELRCEGSKAAAEKGAVQVLKDAGTRRMAAHPPTTIVPADGRDYTILYQNRLPDIQLVWRTPSPGEQLRLIHEFETKTRTLQLAEPAHLFSSGSLVEGKHVLHFQGGGKLSRRTTVTVAFENAAPKATLDTPATVAAQPGDQVTISGTALEGWAVSIEGQAPKRDAQGRFSLAVTWPRERRALSIRLDHPERGAHVYLRRARP